DAARVSLYGNSWKRLPVDSLILRAHRFFLNASPVVFTFFSSIDALPLNDEQFPVFGTQKGVVSRWHTNSPALRISHGQVVPRGCRSSTRRCGTDCRSRRRSPPPRRSSRSPLSSWTQGSHSWRSVHSSTRRRCRRWRT